MKKTVFTLELHREHRWLQSLPCEQISSPIVMPMKKE